MALGIIPIIAAFVFTCVSTVQYFRIGRFPAADEGVHKRALRLARISFYAASAAAGLAGVILMVGLLTHQFQVSYVSQYSSLSLPLGYLISAFWAGQEGTFLLWVLLTAIMGIIFIRSSKQFEDYGMMFINIVQGVLLAILIKKSPFELLPQIPADGNGLNPLLQNPWMVVHPPILFVGYAAMAFPFSIALAALARREYGRWIHAALPWTIFTSVMLGAGIVIGGFWAYEVLGWGGYWGWDPVENSSLIPWLTVLALLHGLLIQKTKGSLQRTNFFLAIISFIMVVYATFLTRSGILADFSVHSFQDLGINTYLMIFIAVTVLFGGGLYIARFREIPSVRLDSASTNRQNTLFIGMMVLCASALVTAVGTSLPIITKMFGRMSQVDVTYYNAVNLPVGILLALALGIAPRLMWKEEGYVAFIGRLVPSTIVGILAAAGAWFGGIHNAGFLLFVFAGAFAFWTNILTLNKNLKLGWMLTGAPLSHIGVALMLVGIVISGQLTQTDRTVLTRGMPERLLGYTLVYTGSSTDAEGKDTYDIRFSSPGGIEYSAEPRLYFNAISNGMMREPDIHSLPLHDFYISPLERPEPAKTALVLKKGETTEIEGYRISFIEFEPGDHMHSDSVRIAAKLQVSTGQTTTVLSPALIMKEGKRFTPALPLPPKAVGDGPAATVSLDGIDVAAKAIHLSIGDAKSDQIVIEMNIKPFMNVLWAGTIVMVLGFMIAIVRRLKADQPV